MFLDRVIQKQQAAYLTAGAICILAGCSSAYTPASTQMGVTSAAISNANNAGGQQYAPNDMASAQDKMLRARKAMEDKDYILADSLAKQAQADAKLAQGKADSAKAKVAADALQEDIRVLREELSRANKQ